MRSECSVVRKSDVDYTGKTEEKNNSIVWDTWWCYRRLYRNKLDRIYMTFFRRDQRSRINIHSAITGKKKNRRFYRGGKQQRKTFPLEFISRLLKDCRSYYELKKNAEKRDEEWKIAVADQPLGC